MFPEKLEGPALLSFKSLFPTRQPHENNSCAFLNFLIYHSEKCSIDLKSRVNVSNPVLELVGDLDPRSSPERQKKNFFS